MRGAIPIPARAESQAAQAEDLVSVQGGELESARRLMPPRDYFTDEISCLSNSISNCSASTYN